MELLFWIPIVGGIPDSRTQDSGYNKKNFIGFDIPDSIQANLIFLAFRNQEFLTWGELLARIRKIFPCFYFINDIYIRIFWIQQIRGFYFQ